MTGTSKLIRRERCPECAKHGRDISEDNLGIFDDGHGYCFSCEYYSPPMDKHPSETYTYQYLAWRGINQETFKAFNSFTKIDFEGKPISIGFRYSNDNI